MTNKSSLKTIFNDMIDYSKYFLNVKNCNLVKKIDVKGSSSLDKLRKLDVLVKLRYQEDKQV